MTEITPSTTVHEVYTKKSRAGRLVVSSAVWPQANLYTPHTYTQTQTQTQTPQTLQHKVDCLHHFLVCFMLTLSIFCRCGTEGRVRVEQRVWRHSLYLILWFHCMLGNFPGTSGVFFFFFWSKRIVTVKNTKDKNPWMYSQWMKNTSERGGWRMSGRRRCTWS